MMSDKKRPVGRPSVYNEEVADEICRRMIEGENLVKICKDAHLPTRMTIYNWYDKHPDFYARCVRAREGLADFLVDEIDELAEKTTELNVNSQKVKIATKQWRAMKMAPRLYGDRVRTEITGADGGAVKIESSVVDSRELDAEQRNALRNILLAAKAKGG
jgi:hypothetical protein